MTGLMQGKRGLIMGLANDRSLAWGIAKKLREQGAELAFSYQGEVIAVDIAGAMAKGMGDAFKDADEDKKKTAASLLRTIAWQEDGAAETPAEDDADDAAEKEAKFNAIAQALTKEAGYRKVEYKGDGVFLVDYQISGSLTHGFLWPYNLDAEVIFPFVVLELRGADQVRVKAPAFGDSDADRKSTRLNSSHVVISYAVFCLKKKT